MADCISIVPPERKNLPGKHKRLEFIVDLSEVGFDYMDNEREI
jgi:hypothetical protein